VNFLADENIDASVVDALRVARHTVLYIAEMSSGVDDEEVLRLATSTQSILLTEDKDFGILVYRLKKATGGVVLVRLAGLSSDAKAEIIATSISNHADKLAHAFTVISPGLVRIRIL